jgi:hypothetical protein
MIITILRYISLCCMISFVSIKFYRNLVGVPQRGSTSESEYLNEYETSNSTRLSVINSRQVVSCGGKYNRKLHSRDTVT